MRNHDTPPDAAPNDRPDLSCPYCHHPAKYMGVGEPHRYQCTVCGAVFEEIHPPMKEVQSMLPD